MEGDSADEGDFGIGSCSGTKKEGQELVCSTPKNVAKEDHSGPSGIKSRQSKAKRKVNDAILLPSLDVSDENEESRCFVSLRSGKKLLKKGMGQMYFDFRKGKLDNASANEGFKDSRERIGEHEQIVPENDNSSHISSSNKGKEKAMGTEDRADSKHKKKIWNGNQSSSSLSVTQKSVINEKWKEKLNGSEEGVVVVGKMGANHRTDEIGMERRVVEERERIPMVEEQRILKKLLHRQEMFYRESPFCNTRALGCFHDEREMLNPPLALTRRARNEEQNAQEAEQSLLNNRELGSMWVPKRMVHNQSNPSAPSLKKLCLEILARNAHSITSLDGIPDSLRYKLSQMVCDFQTMDVHFFDLLLRGSPTEICLHDCSQLTEDEFVRSFEECDISKLMVLQLDHFGCCISDYVLPATLAPSSNSLPALKTLSLSGAYRLSDAGLSVLISSAPVLKSINLSQCCLLSSSAINTLAYSLGSSLRELHLSDCQSLDGTNILSAMKKFEMLEVLSLAGIESISDEFVKEFVSARGRHLKELFLRDCLQLTDSSMEVIARTCSELRALDLANLCKLTDSSLGHLADGSCRIRKLKLGRNNFSDESLACYLETSGYALEELSLNNIEEAGRETGLSLAKRANKLVRLDLSWCRKMSEDCVGLIADNCWSLKVLKLFGCTQITDYFLRGHSNPKLQIIGRQNGPILAEMDMPDAETLAFQSVLVL